MRRFRNQPGQRPGQRPVKGKDGSTLSRLLLAVLASSVVFLASGQPATAATPQPPLELPAEAGLSAVGETSTNPAKSWIVAGIPGHRTGAIAARSNARPVVAGLGIYRVKRSGATRLARRLNQAGRLVYAEPDVPVNRSGYPLDRLWEDQWWLNRIVNPGDVTPPEVTSDSPMIALIEESLDRNHPDLSSANLTGALSVSPEADWHGTAIAGIIGSPGEMLGIRGAWPGARMRLFPSGLTCSTSSKAVTRAVNQGAAVINMSYTFPAKTCFTHFKATQYAVKQNVVPVAAAGNSGSSGNAPYRPATDPHVLSVGAIDDASRVAPFSTRNNKVDIAAPGVDVLAPVVRNDGKGAFYDWDKVSGTSFAAPMVSAAAAWLRQLRPNLGNLQIARILTGSAADLGVPGRDRAYGEGLLSIEKSLLAPVPTADPFEPNDEIRWVNGAMLKRKTPFLWRPGAGRKRVLTATLSRAKDPADVYRVMIPARRRVAVHVTQLEGDVVLSALKPGLKSIYKPGRHMIVRSDRRYPKTEGIVVRNLKRKRQMIWLAVTPSRAQQGNYATYRIRVTRK